MSVVYIWSDWNSEVRTLHLPPNLVLLVTADIYPSESPFVVLYGYMHIKCSCRLCSTEVFFQKVFGWFVIWTDTLQPARDYSDALTLYLFGDVITGSVQEHGNNVSNQPKFWNFPSSKFGFCSFLKDKLKKWLKPVNLWRNPLFYREASKWAKLQGCKNDFTKSAASWCCSHTEIGTVSKICWLFLTAPPFFLIHINHKQRPRTSRSQNL